MSSRLVIGHFYKKHLNLYGDNGNVEVLVRRASSRGYAVEVLEIDPLGAGSPEVLSRINFIFMGGGPDSGQKLVYEDLLLNKKSFLQDYIGKGGAGLFVCGAYQLLGRYYKSSDGSMLQGLDIFDAYTEHFGLSKPRCIGNTQAKLSSNLLNDPVFKNVNQVGDYIVGFENHGGRTYLTNKGLSLAEVTKGHGNNSEDGTEGFLLNNSVGTYFHGPLLSKNPHLADYLLAKSLSLDTLPKLDDKLIITAHSASMKLNQ
jgi:lipid II isoglutaminyl synthase (glutamine-hydrolysing)